MNCPSCRNEMTPESLTCEECGAKTYKAKLRVSMENGQSHTHYLLPRSYSLGRDEWNDIVLEDPSVSRHHAEITYSDAAFTIRDLDSKNGSLLNNHPLKSSRLQDMDCIQLGDVVLFFSDERALPGAEWLATEEFVKKEFFRFSEHRTGDVATQDVLTTMLHLAMSLLHADRGLLFQLEREKKLTFRIGRDPDGNILEDPQVSSVDSQRMQQAATSSQMQIVPERETENGRWQKLIVPLMPLKTEDANAIEFFRDDIFGIAVFEAGKKAPPVTGKKRELLGALTRQLSYALQNELLYGEALQSRRISFELSLAKEIQKKLFPVKHHHISDYEVVSFFQPCAEISGDYFDIVPIGKERVAIAIGDICGKGVPAALLASTVQAAIRSQVEYTTSPTEIVHRLNRLLIASTAKSIFLTLFFGILELHSGELRYINAGHPPPIFIPPDLKIRELSSTTPALGIFEAERQAERQIQFGAGDILLMYTDGVIESQNKEKKIYGRKRFTQMTHRVFNEKKIAELTLDAILDTLKRDITEFIAGAKQSDDLTLLALRRKQPK